MKQLVHKKVHTNNREVDTPQKPNMTMKKQPFEDVFPLKIGDFPLSYLYHDSFFRGVVFIFKGGRLECCVVGVLFFRKHVDCLCYGRCVKVYPMSKLRNVHPCGLT